MERILTVKEAKRILGVTTLTIQRWDKAGKIIVVRTVGGTRRIPESEVRRLLSIREGRITVGYQGTIRITELELVENDSGSYEIEVLDMTS